MKRLYRSRTDVKIDGVCGGIAEYLGIDPTIIRLIWLILALSGTGIVAYIVCIVIIPKEPRHGSDSHSGKNDDVIDCRNQNN